jgi:hypothetical protein
MTRVIPTHVVTGQIDELRRKLEAVRGLPEGERAVKWLEASLDMLNDLLDAGEASAEDRLDRAGAMEWSGLGKDALDGYPNTGSYGSKRWRRGDLPIRTPFGSAGEQPEIAPKSESERGTANDATRAPASSPQDRLKAALAKTAA